MGRNDYIFGRKNTTKLISWFNSFQRLDRKVLLIIMISSFTITASLTHSLNGTEFSLFTRPMNFFHGVKTPFASIPTLCGTSFKKKEIFPHLLSCSQSPLPIFMKIMFFSYGALNNIIWRFFVKKQKQNKAFEATFIMALTFSQDYTTLYGLGKACIWLFLRRKSTGIRYRANDMNFS